MTTPLISDDDIKIGLRFRQARVESGFTQSDIARYFFLSSQQIQKFESGQNRVSAKMLYRLAKICQKSMDWFVQDLEIVIEAKKQQIPYSPFMFKLIRNLRHIDNTKDQQKVLKLIKVFVDSA